MICGKRVSKEVYKQNINELLHMARICSQELRSARPDSIYKAHVHTQSPHSWQVPRFIAHSSPQPAGKSSVTVTNNHDTWYGCCALLLVRSMCNQVHSYLFSFICLSTLPCNNATEDNSRKKETYITWDMMQKVVGFVPWGNHSHQGPAPSRYS